MKLDFLKCIDILMVAFVAIAWSQPIWGQPAGKLSGSFQEKAAQKAKLNKERLDKAICEHESKKPQTVLRPADVAPYPVAYKRCMELRAK